MYDIEISPQPFCGEHSYKINSNHKRQSSFNFLTTGMFKNSTGGQRIKIRRK